MRAASTVLSESTRCSAAASRMFGLLCTSVSTASPCKYSQSRYVAFDARRKRGKDRNKRHMCSDYGKPHKLSLIAAKTAVEGRRSQLHEELVDFAWRCSPTPASIRLAELSTRAIELAWERATEHPPIVAAPFGSQPCATALPGGDLDVSVYLSAPAKKAKKTLKTRQFLMDLHTVLQRTQTFPGASQFINARVPIVTGSLVGGMRVDISARPPGDTVAEDGLALMQACLNEQPQARPLLIAFKALVKQDGLNKVFTGGFSSFALFNMVCGLLQHQAVNRSRDVSAGFLPDLHKLPSQGRLARMQYTHLPSNYLPDPTLSHEQGSPRFSYCVVHAASAPWHLPHKTPMEIHAFRQGQEYLPATNDDILMSGSESEDNDHFGDVQNANGKVNPALKHLAHVRESVNEGPDLGDLFLDVLNRYGKRWSRNSDSLHLRRMDPFVSPVTESDFAYTEEDEERDRLAFEAFLMDMEYLSDADESDKEQAMGDLSRGKGKKKPPQDKKGKKGGGNMPRWAQKGDWEDNADYCIYSPFQSESAPDVNIAGGSSQGRKFQKCLETSAWGLVKATLEWADRQKKGRQVVTQRRAAVASVHAVVAYLGRLTEAQRERLLRECELSVLCRPGVAKLRSKAASLEASLKQARKAIQSLQKKIKDGKAPKNIAAKVNKRILKQRQRMEEWETELQVVMDQTDPMKQTSLLKLDTSHYMRWGSVLGKGVTGKEGSEGIKLQMHSLADAMAEALLEIREDDIVHKYAQAAAHSLWSKDQSNPAAKEYIESRPELETALKDLCYMHGPSSTDVWLSGLKGSQLDAVIDFAEWALHRAVDDEVLGCQPQVMHIRRHCFQTHSEPSEGSVAWKWERARIAVQPKRAYPVLGSVLNVGRALNLPDVAYRSKQHASVLERATQRGIGEMEAAASEQRAIESVELDASTTEVASGTTSTSGDQLLEDDSRSSTSFAERGADLDVLSLNTDDEVREYSEQSGADGPTLEPSQQGPPLQEHGVDQFGGDAEEFAPEEVQKDRAGAWAHRKNDHTQAIEDISSRMGPKEFTSTESDGLPSIGVEEQVEMLARKQQQQL